MLKRTELLTGILAASLLFLLMAVTFVDVFGRNLLNHPLTGASEITEVLLACIIFLMLPHVALRQQHIVIDLVDSFSGRVARIAMDIFAALLSCGMFGLIAVELWVLGNKAAGYGDATPSLGIPLAPVFYFIAVLSAINAAAFLLSIPGVFAQPEPEKGSAEADAKGEADKLPFSV